MDQKWSMLGKTIRYRSDRGVFVKCIMCEKEEVASKNSDLCSMCYAWTPDFIVNKKRNENRERYEKTLVEYIVTGYENGVKKEYKIKLPAYLEDMYIHRK